MRRTRQGLGLIKPGLGLDACVSIDDPDVWNPHRLCACSLLSDVEAQSDSGKPSVYQTRVLALSNLCVSTTVEL